MDSMRQCVMRAPYVCDIALLVTFAHLVCTHLTSQGHKALMQPCVLSQYSLVGNTAQKMNL